MSSTPITTITLYKVPFDRNYKNVTDFANDTERQAYLNTLPHRQFTAMQYVRRNSKYNLPVAFDTAEQYNYAVYNNGEGLGNEYAFITEKQFVNFDTTAITLDIDKWQNNLFNLGFSGAYVVREHQNRTNAGSPVFNIKPDIEAKANVTKDRHYIGTGYPLTTVFLCMVLEYENTHHYQTYYGGWLGDGLCQIWYPINVSNGQSTVEGLSPLTDIVKVLKCPRIKGLFFAPYGNYSSGTITATFTTSETGLESDITLTGLQAYTSLSMQARTISSTASIDSINTAEPKIDTYPYTYYELTNGNKTVILRNEFMNNRSNNTLPFEIRLLADINGVFTQVVPTTYTQDENTEKLDFCIENYHGQQIPLRTDAYIEYVANNRASMNSSLALKGILSAASVALGVYTGGAGLALGVGAGISEAGAIGNELLKRADLQEKPESVATGDSATQGIVNRNYGGRVTLQKVTVNEQTRATLINYWYMFGYPCNEWKSPNLRSRKHFNYIETKGVQFTGISCVDEREALENAFNNGITIWHYRNGTVRNYGDYSQGNNEV